MTLADPPPSVAVVKFWILKTGSLRGKLAKRYNHIILTSLTHWYKAISKHFSNILFLPLKKIENSQKYKKLQGVCTIHISILIKALFLCCQSLQNQWNSLLLYAGVLSVSNTVLDIQYGIDNYRFSACQNHDSLCLTHKCFWNWRNLNDWHCQNFN